MKHFYYVLVFFLISVQINYSQVGIGNTDPKASLDISASNSATPSNKDGIFNFR